MNQNVQTARGRWRAIRLGWVPLGGWLLAGTGGAPAHEQLAAFVQHHVHLSVGKRYIDVTLDLTFFEDWSARERLAMDANRDGRITRAESEAYLKKLAPDLARQVRLRVAGHEFDLTPLYDPELDLLGSNQTGPARHRLRLWFFGPTPANLRPGDDIVIEDRLWSQAQALATFQAEGRDGWGLDPVSDESNLTSTVPGEARRFHTRCLRAPQTKPLKP